nr:MAG TPA: hypothetical protein [Caudoviricetes sp.]
MLNIRGCQRLKNTPPTRLKKHPLLHHRIPPRTH